MLVDPQADQTDSETAGADPSRIPRVLYLGGLGRSGSTILERLLGEVPGMCAVGELVHLWQRGVLDDERCSCGRPFSRCPFWTEVGERAFGGWERSLARHLVTLRLRVDRIRFVPSLAVPPHLGVPRAALQEYVSAFLELYDAIRHVSGDAVVVDSSKHSSLAFCLRTSGRLDLRVVHIVRDSRGVAYSWTKEVRRPESEDAGYMARYSPARSALLWDAHNVLLALLPRLGTSTRRVRYEDLVADPAGILQDLADFAGVPVDRRALAFLDGATAQLSVGHTVSGNPVRFHTGPIRLRADDEWRSRLPRRQQWVTSALTLPLLARYGYLRRPFSGHPPARTGRSRQAPTPDPQ